MLENFKTMNKKIKKSIIFPLAEKYIVDILLYILLAVCKYVYININVSHSLSILVLIWIRLKFWDICHA